MSYYCGDLNEQYLTRLFDDVQKEHQKLLTEMKTLKMEEAPKEMDIQRQIALVNTLMTTILKLKNLKKKIALKSV